MARYIDPKTDFGFKRLFAQEDSKDILKQFLFDVLPLTHPIQELSYIPNEQLPQSADERVGVYDVYCTDVLGQRFIVETKIWYDMARYEAGKVQLLRYLTAAGLHKGYLVIFDEQLDQNPLLADQSELFEVTVDEKILRIYLVGVEV